MDTRTDKRLNKYQFGPCLQTCIRPVSLFRHTIGRLHECSEFNIVVKLVSVSYWPPRGNNLIWTCVTSLKLNLIFSQSTSAAGKTQIRNWEGQIPFSFLMFNVVELVYSDSADRIFLLWYRIKILYRLIQGKILPTNERRISNTEKSPVIGNHDKFTFL